LFNSSSDTGPLFVVESLAVVGMINEKFAFIRE